MNHIPSDRLASEPPMAVGFAATRSRTLAWAAWIATLALSNLPLVIARDVLGTDIPSLQPDNAILAAPAGRAAFALHQYSFRHAPAHGARRDSGPGSHLVRNRAVVAAAGCT